MIAKPHVNQGTKTPIHHVVVRGARKVHSVVAAKPHDFLTRKSHAYRTWHTFKYHKQIHIAALLLGIFGMGAFLSVNLPRALALNSWTQTDWTGGVGGSTSTQFASATNLDTGTANAIKLQANSEKFTNTGLENGTDLDNWLGVSPASISGLQLHVKADSKAYKEISTLTLSADTEKIQTWSDLSGNNNDFFMSTSGQQPTYVANGFNGRPVIHTNATNSQAMRSPIDLSTSPFSVLYVGQQTGPTRGRMLSSSANNWLLGWWGGQRDQAYYGGWVSSGGASGGTSIYQYTGTSDGATTSKLYNNGTQLFSNGGGLAGPNGLSIGGFNGNSEYSDGNFAEIIAYNVVLSDPNRTALDNYLGNKYALPGRLLTLDADVKHGGSNSLKVVTGGNTSEILQMQNVGNTNNYLLTAYAYIDGSAAVDATKAELYANGSALTTNYASVGGGWYKLTATVAGANASRSYGLQVKANQTVYVDDFSLQNYAASGTLTSNIFDGLTGNDWGTLTYGSTLPASTSISVKVRTGNNSNLSDATAFASCGATTSGSDVTSGCALDNKRYAQYQIAFSTSDTSVTPTLTSFALGYTASDAIEPITNASNVSMKTSPSGASISSNGWSNAGTPYFSWTAGADDVGGAGIKGYCLYLGQDSSANPVTSKGVLGTSPLDTAGACQFAVSGTSVDLATSGYIATPPSTSNTPYYISIRAIDNGNNVFSASSAQFHYRFDSTPPVNPTFITAPSQFVASKDVTLTWPTNGNDAPSDDHSGLAGLQYRIGNTGTWYGAQHNGSQDITDLLPNDGSYQTVSSPDYGNLSDGNNIIAFRTFDTAGNISQAFVTTVIKINSSSPSAPQNVTATPSSNTTNSFAFSWLAPASFTGSANNLTYCYTVNALPNSSSCTFTPAGVRTLSAGAYATQPGENTFYVVAKDEAGNINYATHSSTTFTANTSAPGIPLNTEIGDISNKEAAAWKLAISWSQPDDIGAGIASYKVFRSTDGNTYNQIATTAGISYVDTDLSQVTYSYRLKACDSANNCGAFSSVVSKLPTGKFTTPAKLASQPSVTVGIRTAKLFWTTDRASDSRVQYSTTSGQYFSTEAANSNQSTVHSIQLDNLAAGTTYYYKAKWTDIDGNTGTSSELAFTTLPAPNVSDVTVPTIGLSKATMQFTTKGAASAKVYYGKSKSFGAVQQINTSLSESKYVTELTGLDDGTQYYYKINTFDQEGNEYDSGRIDTFTTPARPRISNLVFQPVENEPTSTQKITWDTNVPATSLIRYSALGIPDTEQVDSKLVTRHELTIRNLIDDTRYTLTARSTDQGGNIAISDPSVFQTALDTRTPGISDISVQTSVKGNGAQGRGQMIITWKTDEPASSQVGYGEGSGGEYNNKSSEDEKLTFDHVVIISDLATSKVYHFQPLSKDKSGNQAKGPDQSAIIGQATDNVLTIILNSLQKVFGI